MATTSAITAAVAGATVPLSLLTVPLVGLVAPLLPTSTAGSGTEATSRVVVAFADDEITESSGLVARGRRFHTVNDSGDVARVFTVDAATGETLAETTFADEEPEDVEALAPGVDGTVWVGDIGDNRRDRGTVQVTRVTPGAGTSSAQRFELAYPDGPHDAEALLVHPRTGRVLVVSKVPLLGGRVYRAPRSLDAGTVHRLQDIGRVRGLVTDGAFFPDGRHLVLRGYDAASVYTYPGLRPVGSFTLPEQEQGEAIAVAPDGRIYLSSEGAHSDVLEVVLPERLRAAMAGGADASGTPSPSSTPTDAAEPGTTGDSGEPTQDPAADDPGSVDDGATGTVLAASAAAVVAAGAAGYGLRAARRRGRRRR